MRLEEDPDIVQGGGVEVLHRADGGVGVGVQGREGQLEQVPERVPVRHVVVALALLLLDHVALVVQVRAVQCGQQGAHPVGLQPQCEVEDARRAALVVVRPVEGGGGVGGGADRLQDRDVLGRRDVARALEHQVLEQVREACPVGQLVAGPDVVPEIDRDGRGRVVRTDHDPQPVVKSSLVDGIVEVDGRADHASHHTTPPTLRPGHRRGVVVPDEK
ncbi:hypothetical protein SDC9_122892 [bioreactor metagenome]|uniref:Uncharacterized protein n=1 Tax=bioreactor metagenome TaxID=1076179 RepID=A0A645CG71_9ZZZZ